MAVLLSGTNNIIFKNAGALLAITVTNIPAEYNHVVLSSNNELCGNTKISFNNGIPVVSSVSSAVDPQSIADTKSIRIYFAGSVINPDKKFYFPVLPGEHNNVKVTLYNNNESTYIEIIDKPSRNIERNKRYYATVNLDNDGGVPSSVSQSEDINTQIDYGKRSFILDELYEVSINSAVSDDIQLAITTDNEENNYFKLSGDGPKGKITLNTPVTTNNLIIDVPNATVEIKPDAGVSTFETITATTSENTLIIPKGVTVQNLDIKKGNVKVFGIINNISSESDIKVFIEDGGEVNNVNTNNITIIYNSKYTEVSTYEQFILATSETKKIKLIKDITLKNTLDLSGYNNDVYIDGNNHKLIFPPSMSGGNGIIVDQVVNYTFKNLTIDNKVAATSSKPAVGIRIQGVSKLNNANLIIVENCTIKLNDKEYSYPINMSGSSQYANLVIDGCILEGSVPVQCWGDNHDIKIENTKLICNYDNSNSYGSHCVSLPRETSWWSSNYKF